MKEKSSGSRGNVLNNSIQNYNDLCLLGSNRKTGFTLLETLISLSILLAFVIPLTTFIYKNHSATDSEKALTGICLLEQESALIKAFPDQAIPVKRRTINGKEWIIKTETAGTGLIQYRMAASDGIKTRANLVFLGNSSDEKK